MWDEGVEFFEGFGDFFEGFVVDGDAAFDPTARVANQEVEEGGFARAYKCVCVSVCVCI